MLSGQLEMSFAARGISRTMGRRQSKLRRAQWWFSRMRQIVDRAIDREPVAPPRPEQTWFPNTYRQPGVTGFSQLLPINSDQREIAA